MFQKSTVTSQHRTQNSYTTQQQFSGKNLPVANIAFS